MLLFSKNKYLFALGFLGVVLYISRKSNRKPKIITLKKIPFGYKGFIMPPFGIVVSESEKSNKRLINHETIHWEQWKREGTLPYALNYISEAIKNGYDKNKYEIEARYEESEYCKLNYTECVRSGKALTIYNPEFRN